MSVIHLLDSTLELKKSQPRRVSYSRLSLRESVLQVFFRGAKGD